MWHLRRKTTLRRLLRRFALRRFFDAWFGKVSPEVHLEHLMPPGELCLWYEMVWHANQLIATQPVQKRQVQQATADYLVADSARVNKIGGDLWEVAEPLRRSQGSKRVRTIGRIIPCVESAQGELLSSSTDIARRMLEHFAAVEGGAVVDAMQVAGRVHYVESQKTQLDLYGTLEDLPRFDRVRNAIGDARS